jgi:hypothetical protein
MKHDKSNNLPKHDYASALKQAVSWLGDRYLLAEPVNRRVVEPPKFYVEPRRWHVNPQRSHA